MDSVKFLLIFILYFIATNVMVIPLGRGADTELKQKIQGIVSYVNSISATIVYDQDRIEGAQKEIVFSRNPDIRYINRYRWDDLRTGDHVKVDYVDRFTQDEDVKPDGTIKTIDRIVDRHVKEITFLDDTTTSLTA